MKRYLSTAVFSFLIALGMPFAVSATDMMREISAAQPGMSEAMMRLDAEECRVLAEAGTILSMMELMERVSALTDGQMLDTALIKQGDEYIYEMEIAGRDGIVRMLLVDARTGAMIKE
jgi:uncharacterized membrane protein YkoI